MLEFGEVIGIGLIVAIGILGLAAVGLWRSTKRLSSSTGQYVELTRESLRVIQAGSLPRLTLAFHDRSTPPGMPVQALLKVENAGGGLAQDVVVVSSWGASRADSPILRPEETSVARFSIPPADWEERVGAPDAMPVPQRVQFVDVYGHSHDVAAQPAGPRTWVATAAP
jgi:hypothetical protein